jgi:hypothetical protein
MVSVSRMHEPTLVDPVDSVVLSESHAVQDVAPAALQKPMAHTVPAVAVVAHA